MTANKPSSQLPASDDGGALRQRTAVQEPAPAEATNAGRGGYSPGFLAHPIEPPTIDAGLEDDTVQVDGSAIIPYTHFSLTLSKSRRFARWVAWNVDGGTLKKIDRKGIPFVKDPRVSADFQNGDELYSGNRLDRGHIARRADLLWGTVSEADSANRDSFYFTNITPQMDDFNQSSKDGVWGRLEDAVFEEVEVQDLRISVFGGPVFQDDDRLYRGIQLPREYWKILAYVEQGQFKSHAFLLTQNLNPLEALDFAEFRVFEVTIPELQERTHLQFSDKLRKKDAFAAIAEATDRKPLDDLGEIRW
jgi:endonuclease G, mitochondrial